VDETLDFALIARLRAVAREEPATEAELRSLLEQGDAWERTLRGRLDGAERRLERLVSRPDTALQAIASELRRIDELRPQLDELRALLADLEEQARRLRTAWLARQAGLAKP
jgi:chromosome segregation ATPase